MHLLKGMALGFLSFFLFVAVLVFGQAFTINNTVLNPGFISSELEKIDIVSLAQDEILKQIPPQYRQYTRAVKNTLTEIKPWVYQEISRVLNQGFEYLSGDGGKLTINFETTPLKLSLLKNLNQTFLETPPPEFQNLTPQQKTQYLQQLQNEIDKSIPSNVAFEVSQESVGAANYKMLLQLQQAISTFHKFYWALILFMFLLVVLIYGIMREIRGSSRVLGIVFLADAFICLTNYLILILGLPSYFDAMKLPAQILSWLPLIIHDLLFPFGIYTLIIGFLGAAFLAVSFIVKGNSKKSISTGNSEVLSN
jgi:hypothetical protein